jgi:hypothetical protein
MPDMDFGYLAMQLGLSDRFRIYTLLICIAAFGIALFRYSRVIGGYVFILLFYVMNTQLRYAELFTTRGTSELFTTEQSAEPTELFTTSESFTIRKTEDPLDNFQDVDKTTTTKPLMDPLNLSTGDLSLAEDFLLKQTESDPNKTDLEKNVVSDIIRQYFVKSNKLVELRDFNDQALKANPIAGPQEITGLASGVM